MDTHLIHCVEVRRIKPDGSGFTVAAGTSDVTSSSVDTAGYDGIEFMIAFGTITSGAVTSLKLQGSSAADTGQADIAGTAQTVADTDDNLVFRSGIYRPATRYVNTFVDRGTQNAVIDGVYALLYAKQGKLPITHGATIGGTPEVFASPAAGTA